MREGKGRRNLPLSQGDVAPSLSPAGDLGSVQTGLEGLNYSKETYKNNKNIKWKLKWRVLCVELPGHKALDMLCVLMYEEAALWLSHI